MPFTLQIIDHNAYSMLDQQYAVFRLACRLCQVDIKIAFADDNHMGKAEQLTPVDFLYFSPVAYDFLSAVAVISKIANRALEESDHQTYADALAEPYEFE
jgi:hypothetical protein